MKDVNAGAEAKPGDTASGENQGQDTALSTAQSAAAESQQGTPKPAVEKPAPATEAKTAFAAAADGSGEETPAGDEKKGGEAEPDGEGKPKEVKAGPVEAALAELELPEGFQIADADKSALVEMGTKHGLTKEAVADLVKLELQREQQRLEAGKAQTQQFISEMRAEADKLPKETLAAANRFVKKFGSKGLQAKMADPAYYIGNDVDIINALAVAQKAVDGGFVDGTSSGAGSEKSVGERLYS